MSFVLHDADDLDRASDGTSRYGAYLRQNGALFADWDDGTVTGDPVQFTVAAWQVATSPVMAPPYVSWTAERLRSVTVTSGEDPGLLIARIQVATPRPAALAGLAGFTGWERPPSWRETRGYHTPGEESLRVRPALLPSVELLFAVPYDLLCVPQDTPGSLTAADAKASVRRLAELLDACVAPVLAAADSAGVA
ncbi:hypothetical protein ACH35V_06770 [Actinomadura sp. 1N219]|uniref:hypothetical protein n=1 Tax=Actinomadura sp. 1N219 TaxID=3375152 RepID=UPI00379EC36C